MSKKWSMRDKNIIIPLNKDRSLCIYEGADFTDEYIKKLLDEKPELYKFIKYETYSKPADFEPHKSSISESKEQVAKKQKNGPGLVD